MKFFTNLQRKLDLQQVQQHLTQHGSHHTEYFLLKLGKWDFMVQEVIICLILMLLIKQSCLRINIGKIFGLETGIKVFIINPYQGGQKELYIEGGMMQNCITHSLMKRFFVQRDPYNSHYPQGSICHDLKKLFHHPVN